MMENHIKMGNFGGTIIFGSTHIWNINVDITGRLFELSTATG